MLKLVSSTHLKKSITYQNKSILIHEGFHFLILWKFHKLAIVSYIKLKNHKNVNYYFDFELNLRFAPK